MSLQCLYHDMNKYVEWGYVSKDAFIENFIYRKYTDADRNNIACGPGWEEVMQYD